MSTQPSSVTTAPTAIATPAVRASLLRVALRLDAAASGAMAVLLLAVGALVTDLLGLPVTLLWPAGVFLVGYAAALWLLASRPVVAAPAAWGVVAANVLWVLGSVLVLVVAPVTALGTVVVIAQAVAVLGFAGAQAAGLRAGSVPAAR